MREFTFERYDDPAFSGKCDDCGGSGTPRNPLFYMRVRLYDGPQVLNDRVLYIHASCFQGGVKQSGKNT
jgi:hypothetical protein